MMSSSSQVYWKKLWIVLPLAALAACGGGGGGGGGGASSHSNPASTAGSASAAASSPSSTSSKASIQATTGSTVSTSFYRIRVEMVSSSDWATLNVSNYGQITTYKTISTTAAKGAYGWYPNTGMMFVTQNSTSAKANNQVQFDMDFVYPTTFTSSPMNLALAKGAIGSTTVRVYAVSGDGSLTLAKQFSATGSSTVSLNAAELVSDKLPVQTVTTPTVPKMMWAVYYTWYNSTVWNSGQIIDYPITSTGAANYYSSYNPVTHDNAINQARSHGVDGFVAAWKGIGTDTDSVYQILVNEADKLGFNLSAYYETQAVANRTPASITADLIYLLQHYATHPSFYHWNGKPVVFIYASNYVSDPTMWAGIFNNVRAAGVDAYFIGMGCQGINLDVFDGVHEYAASALNLSYVQPQTLAGYDQACSRMVRNYHLMSTSHTRKLWVAPTQPGFNNTHTTEPVPTVISRNGGQYYASTMNAALQSTPDWILITSWNEWMENTEIEASHYFGSQYLNATATYSQQWKSAP